MNISSAVIEKFWDNVKKTPTCWNWTGTLDKGTPCIHYTDGKPTSMTDSNFQKAWSLDNLRPLSAKQNITENNRR